MGNLWKPFLVFVFSLMLTYSAQLMLKKLLQQWFPPSQEKRDQQLLSSLVKTLFKTTLCLQWKDVREHSKELTLLRRNQKTGSDRKYVWLPETDHRETSSLVELEKAWCLYTIYRVLFLPNYKKVYIELTSRCNFFPDYVQVIFFFFLRVDRI